MRPAGRTNIQFHSGLCRNETSGLGVTVVGNAINDRLFFARRVAVSVSVVAASRCRCRPQKLCSLPEDDEILNSINRSLLQIQNIPGFAPDAAYVFGAEISDSIRASHARQSIGQFQKWVFVVLNSA